MKLRNTILCLSWATIKSSALKIHCPPYSASSTSSATGAYSECKFEACDGDSAIIGVCQNSLFSGDTYLRLVDNFGHELALNDDYCGGGSQLSYTFTGSCQEYIDHASNTRVRVWSERLYRLSGPLAPHLVFMLAYKLLRTGNADLLEAHDTPRESGSHDTSMSVPARLMDLKSRP